MHGKFLVMKHELLSFNLFSSCSESDIAELLQCSHRRVEFRVGQVLVRQGDACRSLVLLSKGEVVTSMGSEEGREVTIDRLQAPQILAPAFLFASNNVFPVDVKASTNCCMWRIDREGFFKFMQDHSDVLMSFLQLISDRGQFLSGKVKSFAVEGLRTRVIDLLSQDGKITNVQSTAAILGVARPSLSRLLSDLVDEGVVVRTEKGFVLYR